MIYGFQSHDIYLLKHQYLSKKKENSYCNIYTLNFTIAGNLSSLKSSSSVPSKTALEHTSSFKKSVLRDYF
jgi:hypothetical protein